MVVRRHKSMMKVVYSFCLALFAIIIVSGCSEERITANASQSTASDVTEQEETAKQDSSSLLYRLYTLINERRRDVGIPPLLWSSELAELASAQAHDMCERGYLSHKNPEGEDPIARAMNGQAGRFVCEPVVPIPFILIGENIARGFDSPESVLTAWMNSPLHRNNILGSEYTHIGIGTCDTSGWDYKGCGKHWVVIFGTETP